MNDPWEDDWEAQADSADIMPVRSNAHLSEAERNKLIWEVANKSEDLGVPVAGVSIPQIRVLKRPTDHVSSTNSTSRVDVSSKTLAQRETDYHEARKRIFENNAPQSSSSNATPSQINRKPSPAPTSQQQQQRGAGATNTSRGPKPPDGTRGFQVAMF